MPTFEASDPEASSFLRSSSGTKIPGTSLCSRSASLSDGSGQIATSAGSGSAAAEAVEQALPRLPVEEHLAHDEVRAGVRLAAQALDLVVEVVGGGVDRDAQVERRRLADRVAGAVEPLGHAGDRAHQLEDVDVVDVVDARVVAELRGVAGDREQVAQAGAPGAEQLRLQAHEAGVARGDVGDGLEAGRALHLGGQPQRVHAQPRQRVGVDVHGVHPPCGGHRPGGLDDAIGVGALGRVELDDVDELPRGQLRRQAWIAAAAGGEGMRSRRMLDRNAGAAWREPGAGRAPPRRWRGCGPGRCRSIRR